MAGATRRDPRRRSLMRPAPIFIPQPELRLLTPCCHTDPLMRPRRVHQTRSRAPCQDLHKPTHMYTKLARRELELPSLARFPAVEIRQAPTDRSLPGQASE